MERLYPALIIDALKNVRYPGNGKNIVELDMVEDDIRIDGNKVSFSLIFEKPTDPFMKSLVKAAETAILTHISPEVEIKGNIAVKTRKPLPEKPANPLPGVKNIIGISSGKGGVGKSTVASNLAVDIRWDCLMPISLVRRCLKCLAWKTSNFLCTMLMVATSLSLSKNMV